MNVLLVRHAESQGNANGDYSVLSHDSLSPNGLAQAKALSRCLQLWSFEAIFVSPLQRAMETLVPYLEATKQRAEIWPELAEACWQSPEEPPSAAWNPQPASVPLDIARYFTYRDNKAVKPSESEAFGQGLGRVHATRERIQALADSPHTFLVVTHGHFLREFLNLLLETPSPVEFPHENCGMTMLTYAQGWQMEFCNRRSTSVGGET